MKTSYALWMPVLLDGELKLICEDIMRRLCDSPDLGGFDLSCEIDKQTRDITIRYKVSRHFFSKKKQIILHKENENMRISDLIKAMEIYCEAIRLLACEPVNFSTLIRK